MESMEKIMRKKKKRKETEKENWVMRHDKEKERKLALGR